MSQQPQYSWRKALPYIAIIVAMLVWGTSTIGTKLALNNFPPITLITLRFTIAVVFMWMIGILTKQLQPLRKEDAFLFILTAFIQPFGYYTFETFGLQMISTPTVAEVILSTIPLFSPLFAWLILRERVTIYNILGVVISMLGVLIMIVAGETAFTMSSPWGYVLLACAVMASVFYAIMLRKIPSHYNDWSIVFYIMFFGTIMLYPVWFVVDFPQMDSFVWDWTGFGAIAYLAVFCTIICYILFCYCVRRIGVTRTNVFNNIRPVFTAMYMLIFFGEQLPLVKWVGIVIVVVGLFVSQYMPKSSKVQKF